MSVCVICDLQDCNITMNRVQTLDGQCGKSVENVCTSTDTSNRAQTGGGGISIGAEAMSQFMRSRIEENVAGGFGGGLLILTGARPAFDKCSIQANVALTSFSVGGAAWIESRARPSFVNQTVIRGNQAGFEGGLFLSDACHSSEYHAGRDWFDDTAVVGPNQQSSHGHCTCSFDRLTQRFTCIEPQRDKTTEIIVLSTTMSIFGCFLLVLGVVYRVKSYRDWTVDESESDVSRFAEFGYGMVDHDTELQMLNFLGQGNFGIVSKAILRRRGDRPARYCAVKSLERGDVNEMIDEVALNSVAFFLYGDI